MEGAHRSHNISWMFVSWVETYSDIMLRLDRGLQTGQKGEFYDSLIRVVRSVNNGYIVILTDDFNAQLDSNNNGLKWTRFVQGIRQLGNNSLMLLGNQSTMINIVENDGTNRV